MESRSNRGYAAAALLAALVAIAIATQAVLKHPYAWIDLDVYRWGGSDAFDASNLYVIRHPTLGMPFTYTPFAALVFAVLDPIGALTPVGWTLLSLAALGRMSWLLARHRGSWLDGARSWQAATLIAAAIVVVQPATSTLLLGQVGFILPWLICEDLLTGRRRSSGVLVGLATAIKLTPGIYLLFLAVVGRIRAAAVGGAVFLITILVGWIALPAESERYWRHLGPDVTTVGPVTTEEHWSINATVWRVHDGGADLVWLPIAVAVLAATVLLARLWWTRGEPAGAVGLVGLGAVLASPFSWSHHWIVVAPLFIGLLAARHRARRPALATMAISVAYALLLTGVWWHLPRRSLDLLLSTGAAAELSANSFVLVAAILLAAAWRLRPRVLHAPLPSSPNAR